MSKDTTKRLAREAIERHNATNKTFLVASPSNMTVVDNNTVISQHGVVRVLIKRLMDQRAKFQVISVKTCA